MGTKTFALATILRKIKEKNHRCTSFQDYYDKENGYGDGWAEYIDTDIYSTDYNDCHGDYFDVEVAN